MIGSPGGDTGEIAGGIGGEDLGAVGVVCEGQGAARVVAPVLVVVRIVPESGDVAGQSKQCECKCCQKHG